MDRQKAQLESEYGHISWWGYSPAMDLIDSEDDTSQNVLLLGASDPRHIIATSSHSPNPSFYISESNIVLYARHILLLSLLFDKDEPTNESKFKRFLLVYGNSLIDEETGVFVMKRCKELSEYVIKSRNLSETDPVYSKIFLGKDITCDLSRLKYREIDALEMVFKNWSRAASQKKNKMISYWDSRNRNLLGIRYGSRDGVYDMDYEMRFKETVPGITSKEYTKWRSSGIAFDWGFEDVNNHNLVDNVTLVSVNIIKNREGNKVAIEGYWGDVVSMSPLIPFGVSPEMKISLEDSKLKSMGSESSIKCLTKLLSTATSRKVIFLPISFIENDCDFIKHKLPKFNNIFIGNSMSHLLTNLSVHSSDALIVETLIGLISLNKEIHIGFQDKINTLFLDSIYRIKKVFNPFKDFYIHLKAL